jgi:hypothetical protein
VIPFCGESATGWVDASAFQQECATFQFKWDSVLPKLLNCLVDRDHFSRWRSKLGTLFFPIAPDYSFAWISSHITDGSRVINRPLTLRGISLHSIGSNAGLSESAEEFLREFGDFDFFADSVLTVPVTINHVAATFARASKSLAATGCTVSAVDHRALILAVTRQIKEVERLLPSWHSYLPQLVSAAERLGSDTRDTVLRILTEPTPSLALLEPVAQTRARTARMARESANTVASTLIALDDDKELAGLVLGFEPGAIDPRDWSSINLIGDHLRLYDPYAVSRHVDYYYDLLVRGHGKMVTGSQVH